MGRDKSRVLLEGRSLLTHTRSRVEELGLPIRVIRRDTIAPCGPLSGIYTALQSSRAEAELFLACDMPFLSAALVRRILDALQDPDLACFATVRELAGFPFVIRTRCAERIAEEIRRGQWSLQKLAATLEARRVAISPDEEGALFNVNTPEDLLTAEQTCRLSP